MIKIENFNYQLIRDKLKINSPWDKVIIFILSILFTVPIFLICHQNLVDFNWPIQLDRILLFLLISGSIFFILKKIRRITLISVIVYILFLIGGTVFGGYGFNSVFEDYRSMMYAMSENPNPQDLIISKLLPFPNKYKILNAIEYKNPKVRNFAIMATNKHFRNVKEYRNEYFTLIQCFAVFKEINSQWNYVSDPKGSDYIATASESLQYLSGDCDDHSILMAACVRAIGGTPRLIHTKGHIYPEIYIGKKSDLEAINYLIKKVLFPNETKDKTLHYHIDERGDIWLNLDYTAKFPGGPFMSEEILGALTLQ
jgi:heme/copper-type cytochrome/quinol oxidase subunit 4